MARRQHVLVNWWLSISINLGMLCNVNVFSDNGVPPGGLLRSPPASFPSAAGAAGPPRRTDGGIGAGLWASSGSPSPWWTNLLVRSADWSLTSTCTDTDAVVSVWGAFLIVWCHQGRTVIFINERSSAHLEFRVLLFGCAGTGASSPWAGAASVWTGRCRGTGAGWVFLEWWEPLPLPCTLLHVYSVQRAIPSFLCVVCVCISAPCCAFLLYSFFLLHFQLLPSALYRIHVCINISVICMLWTFIMLNGAPVTSEFIHWETIKVSYLLFFVWKTNICLELIFPRKAKKLKFVEYIFFIIKNY